MLLRVITLISILCVVLFGLNWFFDEHGSHKPGMKHGAISGNPLKEGGEATFAALTEVVQKLENEKSTDWAVVDVDGLREHLLDMNRLMSDTQTTKKIIGDDTIQYVVHGTKESVSSIHRMIPVHSQFLELSRGWKIITELNDSGATITVSANEIASVQKLYALGFYGFMVLDSHHQAHHYQMVFGMTH